MDALRARTRFLSDFCAESGELLLKFSRQRREVFSKGGRDIVTSADHAVDALLVKRLAQDCFADSILSEERPPVHTESGYRWIIDPVDGTSNFAHGSPLYCMSLALQKGGKTVAGAVIAPQLREFFYAERGKGAFLNGKRIRVGNCRRLYDLVVAAERQPTASNVEKSLRIELPIAKSNRMRTLGSAALDLCFVACGRFDAFFCTSIFAWDVAAGALIVEEAKGKAGVPGAGTKFEFSREPFGFAAGNKQVYGALAKALR